jgi:Spy/CpxP family protein refolding chaperone
MKNIAVRLAAACAACLIAAPAALAQTPPPGDAPAQEGARRGPPGPHEHGRVHERNHDHDHHRDHGRGPGPLAGLRGLALSEAQQDRIFAIVHDTVPKQRALDKKERQARRALREMAGAAQVDRSRAGAHAEALGRAVADQALLRLERHAAVMAVLTPEQRASYEQRRARVGRDRP